MRFGFGVVIYDRYISNSDSCTDACINFHHNLEWMTAESLRFMRNALNESKPFFAYINPTPPHGLNAEEALQDTSAETGLGPYTCTSTAAGPNTTEADGGASDAAWAALCGDDNGANVNFSEWCRTDGGCDMNSRDAIWASVQGEETDSQEVAASIAWVDDALSSIYDFLELQGELNNTIILVLTDNGQAKGTIYEYGVRTIFNLRYPNGGVLAGTQVDTPVTNIDVVSTLFDFIGINGTFDTDGISLVPLLNGGSIDRDAIYVEMAKDVGVIETSAGSLTGHTGTRLKLIHQDQVSPNTFNDESTTANWDNWMVEYQLYDLSTDMIESINLVNASELAAALAILNTSMMSHIANISTNNAVQGTMSVSLLATTTAALTTETTSSSTTTSTTTTRTATTTTTTPTTPTTTTTTTTSTTSTTTTTTTTTSTTTTTTTSTTSTTTTTTTTTSTTTTTTTSTTSTTTTTTTTSTTTTGAGWAQCCVNDSEHVAQVIRITATTVQHLPIVITYVKEADQHVVHTEGSFDIGCIVLDIRCVAMATRWSAVSEKTF